MSINGKIYTLISVFLLIIAAMILVVVMPILNDIKKSSSYLISSKNEIASMENQSKELDLFLQKQDDYVKNLDGFEKALVISADPVDFIKFLEQTAQASSLSSKISALTPETQNNKKVVTLQLSVLGSFSNIIHYIGRLENGSYLLEVQKLNIENYSQAEKVEDNGQIRANFTVQALAK